MNIKKIQLNFKNGYLTPLESDTIFWYVFAKHFSELETIFNKFKAWEAPFLLSNWFIDWKIARPVIFHDSNHEKTSLLEDLKEEKEKKKLKSLNFIPFKKDILRVIFEDPDKIPEILKETYEEDKKTEYISSEMKNSMPRFSQGETVPFVINDIKFSTAKYNIYVKIFDESDFEKFFELMQKTLLSIGWGKWVSRWYGKISLCELVDLSQEEKEAFDYIEQLKKNNQIIVLNNYKPSDTEIDNMDLNKSYLQFINKNTKTSDKNTFKWNMKFIAPGSVVYVNDWEIVGSYYQVWTSFNFWYLF